MSIRALSLMSPKGATYRIGDGASFSTMNGYEMSLDTMFVKNLHVDRFFTGDDRLPIEFFFGTAKLPQGASSITPGNVGTYPSIALPQALYYNQFDVEDPLNPYISASINGPLVSIAGAATTNTQVPACVVTCWPYQTASGPLLRVDGIYFQLNGEFPGGAAGTGARICWYAAGAPPQSPPSPWGVITIESQARHTSSDTLGSYTLYKCNVSGGCQGAQDVNQWKFTVPPTDVSGVNPSWELPYTTTAIFGALTPPRTVNGQTSGWGAEPFDISGGEPLTPGLLGKNWTTGTGAAAPTAAEDLSGYSLNPGFWVQQATLNIPNSSGGTFQRQYYGRILGQPKLNGKGIAFSVYGRTNQDVDAPFKMDIAIGNNFNGYALDANYPVGTGVTQPYLSGLYFGCCSESFSLNSVRWSVTNSDIASSTGSGMSSYNGGPIPYAGQDPSPNNGLQFIATKP